MAFLLPFIPAVMGGTAGAATAAGTAAAVGGAAGSALTAGSLMGAGSLATGLTGLTALAAPVASATAIPAIGAAATTATAGASLMNPWTFMALGQGVKAVSEYKAGQANAEVSKAQAKQATLNAQYNESRSREASARIIGEQIANIPANVGGVTPWMLVSDQKRQAELEALAIRTEGKITSNAYKNEARGYRRAASNSLIGGLMSTAGYGYVGYKGGM